MKLKTFILILFFSYASADSVKQEYELSDLMNLSLEELMNVKVTAGSFFEEKKEDVASTVLLVTREDWRRRGAKNTTQAVAHLPGVHQNTHLDLENIVIRGFQNPLSYRGVLILVDGVPLNSYTFSSGTQRIGLLESYNQIQLVKGPSSTLYGSDAFSGVMSLNTWDSDSNTTEIGVEYGSFDFYEGSYKNVKNFKNGFRTTINLTLQGQDNEKRDYQYLDLNNNLGFTQLRNKHKVFSLIGKVHYRDSTISYYRHSLETKGRHGFNFIPLGHDDGSQTDRDTDMNVISFDHNVDVGKIGELRLKSYYWEADTEASYGNDPGPVGYGTHGNIDQEDERSGIEIKHLYQSTNERFKVVSSISQEKIATGEQASFGASPPAAISHKERKVSSVFINMDYKLKNDKVKLIMGGRLDEFSDINDKQLSPRVGAIYYHNTKHLYKLHYANSFRAPNVQEIIGLPGAVTGGGEDLKPEKHDSWELVHSYRDDKLSLVSTAFYSRLKDVIQIDSLAIEYQNKNPSKAYGFELEAVYKRKQLELYASGSYVNSWQSEPVKDSTVYEGFPDWLLNYGFEYKMLGRPVDISAYNTHRIGARNRQNSPTTSVPEGVYLRPYFRTDLTMTYHFAGRAKRHKGFVSIRNLMNRDNFMSSNETSLKGRKEANINLIFGYRVKF